MPLRPNVVPATNAPGSDGSGKGTLTIFVVDDDDSLRRSLARLLRSAGWKVETFGSGPEFLERPAYTGTGCAVIDLRMPAMTGTELHAEMTARGISLPVVFLTAHGDVPTGVQAMKRGAVDFLVKPAEDETLLQTIRRGVERHAAEQADQRQRRDIEVRLSRLSPREREVLKFVIGGHLNKQIADRMSISLKTVKAHRARVMEKMEVDSLAALVHLCQTAGVEFPERHPGVPVSSSEVSTTSGTGT